MQYKDYYKIMSVSRDASADEIKKAYRKLARKYHPDVSKEKNAEEKFKEVQEAYEVLKDSKKRKAYDQLGANWKAQQEFTPPPGWHFDFGGTDFGPFEQTGFSDFFENLFGGGFAGRASRGKRHGFAARGEDIHSELSISLEEAFLGVKKAIQLQVPTIQPNGRASAKLRTLHVKIPKGVTQGQQIRLTGQGGEGMGGAPAGDLYLKINIQPHAIFKLQDRDVMLTLPITPWEAALGTKIEVPTLTGNVQLKISEGAQSGQKLRLKDRGLCSAKEKGDQYVILKMMTPKPQTPEQKQFYEKMAQIMPFNPRK
ncbi:MAG: DnaJ domain-containing protein [Gammaproteobacteria bacterium]|nr:DnaJ domain-containing protein [Gammaproteobacteria bacterium]